MTEWKGPEGLAKKTMGRLLTDLLIVLAVAIAVTKISGCATRSPAAAETLETRLTQDGAMKLRARFSPDGAWIAYASSSGNQPGSYSTFVVSPHGGEPRRLSPDSLSVYPLSWTRDGTAILCRAFEGGNLYRVGIDGSAALVHEGAPLVRLLDLADDGKTELVARFNVDNRDVGIRKAEGKIEFLAETPEWEEEGVFGPAPGEVTVVSMPSFQADVSTISTWSPVTKSYAPLPLPEGRKSQPTWTADGSRLAYVAERNGQTDILVYRPGTARATPLVEDPLETVSPSWSPDGEWLAFIRSSYTSHLYVGEPGTPEQRQLTDGPARDYSPVGSPDGKWVAFIRKMPGSSSGPGSTTLCIVPSQGGDVREIELEGLALPGKGAMIAWSSDSRNIAFNASDGSAKMDIYRVGRDGTGLTRVTIESGEEVEPKWSPDGRYLCYTKAGAGGLSVAVVPAHGGLARVISPPDRKSEGGIWSPQSDRVAHVSFGTDGSFELWITSLDPAKPRRLVTRSATLLWPLRWTQDGSEVLVTRQRGRAWTLDAVSTATGASRQVGTYSYLASGRDMYCRFDPADHSKYAKLCDPAGIVVADGRDSSDLYLMRTRESRQPRAVSFVSDRFQWRGPIAWVSCF